jgi:hypothetical protein
MKKYKGIASISIKDNPEYVPPKGERGDMGLMGPIGLQGIKGDMGPMGATGETGPMGPIGLQGIKGDMGPMGLKGDKGDDGKIDYEVIYRNLPGKISYRDLADTPTVFKTDKGWAGQGYLNSLADVSVSGIAKDQSIKWDGAKWVAYDPSSGGGTSHWTAVGDDIQNSNVGNVLISNNIFATGTVLGSNLSGTNTGDNAVNSLYSGLASSKYDASNPSNFISTVSVDGTTITGNGTPASPLAASGGGGSSPWTTSGANIHNSNAGGVGIGQPSPLAELHVTPFPKVSNLSNTINVGVPTGYLFGTGSKQYGVYSEQSSFPVFSGESITNFTEPASADYDPSGGTAAVSYVETGYIANGYSYQYQAYALYGGQTQIGNGFATTNSDSDNGDGISGYAVDVSYIPPIGAVAPDAYLVLSQGSNPNTGLYKVIFGTSFIDNNTGWASSSSYSALLYSVNIAYSPAPSPADNSVITNDSTNTYFIGSNSGSATDDGTWTTGPATVTPTAPSKTAIFDGPEIDFNGVPYFYPPSVSSGGFQKVDGSGNVYFQNTISPANIGSSYTNVLAFFGAGAYLSPAPNLAYNGVNFRLNSTPFGITVLNDNSTSGTSNNYPTGSQSAYRFGGGNITMTGFDNGFSGKILNITTGNGITITYKNDAAGSTSANRILTGNGFDYIQPPLTTLTLIYDGSDVRWMLQPLQNSYNGVYMNTLGTGIHIKEGTNATMGQVTLVGGTKVVSTTLVTANSRIFLTVDGGTLTNVGFQYISARTAGTSFTIKSSNVLDTSNVSWMIVEPL